MFDDDRPSTHPVDVGIRTEGAILGELSKAGYDVLSPFSYNRRYDYAIDLGDHFVRAQCKTGRVVSGAIEFARFSVRCSTTAVHRRRYASDEVDIFLVWCPARPAVYVVDVAQTVTMLRVEPTANNQRKGINWASDHLLGSGAEALRLLPLGNRLVGRPE